MQSFNLGDTLKEGEAESCALFEAMISSSEPVKIALASMMAAFGCMQVVLGPDEAKRVIDAVVKAVTGYQ